MFEVLLNFIGDALLDEEAELVEAVDTGLREVLGALLEAALDDEEGPELLDMLLETAEIVETVEAGLREVLDTLLEVALAAEVGETELREVLGALLEVTLDK